MDIICLRVKWTRDAPSRQNSDTQAVLDLFLGHITNFWLTGMSYCHGWSMSLASVCRKLNPMGASLKQLGWDGNVHWIVLRTSDHHFFSNLDFYLSGMISCRWSNCIITVLLDNISIYFAYILSKHIQVYLLTCGVVQMSCILLFYYYETSLVTFLNPFVTRPGDLRVWLHDITMTS